MVQRNLVERCTVRPGHTVELDKWPTDWLDAGWVDRDDADDLKSHVAGHR